MSADRNAVSKMPPDQDCPKGRKDVVGRRTTRSTEMSAAVLSHWHFLRPASRHRVLWRHVMNGQAAKLHLRHVRRRIVHSQTTADMVLGRRGLLHTVLLGLLSLLMVLLGALCRELVNDIVLGHGEGRLLLCHHRLRGLHRSDVLHGSSWVEVMVHQVARRERRCVGDRVELRLWHLAHLTYLDHLLLLGRLRLVLSWREGVVLVSGEHRLPAHLSVVCLEGLLLSCR